jgi:hypothetical protein
MLSGTVLLQYILSHYSIGLPSEKELNFYCENWSVVNKIRERLQRRRTVNQHRHPDVDIELQLIHELQLLKSKGCIIGIHHVKGHQDSTSNKNKLKVEEELNIFADQLTHKARTLPPVTKYEPFTINSVSFTAYHSIALRDYFITKHGWNNKTIDSIWWQTHYQSIKKLPESSKIRIRKFIHNLWPTLHRDQKYKTHPSSLCKQCGLYIEREDHIIRCRTKSRQHLRDQWQKEIMMFLSKPHTPITVRQYLSHGFFSW